MNVQASDSEVFMAALTDQARAANGDHPQVETLLDYLAGELAGTSEARVNDHLVGCLQCSAQLLDLETLSEPEIPRSGVADLATEAAWREIRARLFPAQETPVPVAPPPAYQRWAVGIAAALLLTTGGMSAWVAQLHRSNSDLQWRIAELSQVQINAPVFYIGETVRSVEEETIEVPAGATHFMLIFTPAVIETDAEYEIRFFDPEGREVLHAGGLTMSESGGLRLSMPRERLPAGRYIVRLSGFDGEQWRQLEEYSYRFAHPEEP